MLPKFLVQRFEFGLVTIRATHRDRLHDRREASDPALRQFSRAKTSVVCTILRLPGGPGPVRIDCTLCIGRGKIDKTAPASRGEIVKRHVQMKKPCLLKVIEFWSRPVASLW